MNQSSNEKKTHCCCKKQPAEGYQKITSEWSRADSAGAVRCRLSNRFRMDYRVGPGLYALNGPDASSPVFVSANYRLSFNLLRRSLAGPKAWVLVLDTKGINVWCAAGKGTFGTAELVKRIAATNLCSVVSHRRLVLPQLGAAGVCAHDVKKATGFTVEYGPVRAGDIPAFLAAGGKATAAMRTVTFSLADRAVLVPQELFPALRKFLWVALGCLVLMGLQPQGILFRPALLRSIPVIAAGLAAVFAGAVAAPLLLPLIPFRSFAIKGAISGAVFLLPFMLAFNRFPANNPFLWSAVFIFFTVASSYVSLLFTGSTAFTSMSGVKKEMKVAVPLYMACSVISGLLLIVYKLQEWGML